MEFFTGQGAPKNWFTVCMFVFWSTKIRKSPQIIVIEHQDICM